MSWCARPAAAGRPGPRLEREVTRGKVAVGLHLERRLDRVAGALHEARAAGVEAAARRRIDRAGDVALEHDRVCGCGPGPGRPREGRQQRRAVGVVGRVEIVTVGRLDHLAEVHHVDLVGHPAHDVEVVGDEQVGEVELLLEVFEQVDDLGLHRHVEGGHRLVAHDQLRLEGERPGDADPLALAARELVGEAVVVLGVEARRARAAPARCACGWRRCRCRGSPAARR